MTLGQPVTLRGQLESGKARRGPGKSFDAFLALQLLWDGGPSLLYSNLLDGIPFVGRKLNVTINQ